MPESIAAASTLLVAARVIVLFMLASPREPVIAPKLPRARVTAALPRVPELTEVAERLLEEFKVLFDIV